MAIIGSYLLGQYEDELAASNQPDASSSLDQDDFLNILVAQLTQQDPSNPMDDKEIATQLAQFASLEQLTNINDNIEEMLEGQERGELYDAVGFIGKEVSASGYTVSKEGGEVSSIYYGLGETVTDMQLNIYDSDGLIVYSENLGAANAGMYEYSWDGTNNNGSEVPDGVYSCAIMALDEAGNQVYVETEVSGVVAGVIYEAGDQYLRLEDGRVLNVLNVVEVVGNGQSTITEESAANTESEG